MEIYVVKENSGCMELVMASENFETIIHTLEKYCDTRVYYFSNGKKVWKKCGYEILRDYYAHKELIIPILDWEKLAEYSINEQELIVDNIIFDCAISYQAEDEQCSIGVWEDSKGKPEQITFWLTEEDYHKFLRKPKRLYKILKNGKYEINKEDCVDNPYPKGKIVFKDK